MTKTSEDFTAIPTVIHETQAQRALISISPFFHLDAFINGVGDFA